MATSFKRSRTCIGTLSAPLILQQATANPHLRQRLLDNHRQVWVNSLVGSLLKAMVFPVVMYGCASWTIKKAERQRIDAFELWCWRRFLRVPWTARRSNQSILKEINSEYSLEGLMLKLQYFGHLMRRTESLGKTLMLGKIEGGRRRGRQDEMAGWHH